MGGANIDLFQMSSFIVNENEIFFFLSGVGIICDMRIEMDELN